MRCDWRAAIVRPNSISGFCAFVSACTLMLPWLVRQSYTLLNPNPDVLDYRIAPNQYYPLLEMAAQPFYEVHYGYIVPPFVALAALVFVLGMIIAFLNPVGGLLQVGSIFAIALFLVQNDYVLMDSVTVRAEYGVGIGFHIGFLASLGTVFSLSASATDFVLRPLKAFYSRMKPLSHRV